MSNRESFDNLAAQLREISESLIASLLEFYKTVPEDLRRKYEEKGRESDDNKQSGDTRRHKTNAD